MCTGSLSWCSLSWYSLLPAQIYCELPWFSSILYNHQVILLDLQPAHPPLWEGLDTVVGHDVQLWCWEESHPGCLPGIAFWLLKVHMSTFPTCFPLVSIPFIIYPCRHHLSVSKTIQSFALMSCVRVCEWLFPPHSHANLIYFKSIGCHRNRNRKEDARVTAERPVQEGQASPNKEIDLLL